MEWYVDWAANWEIWFISLPWEWYVDWAANWEIWFISLPCGMVCRLGCKLGDVVYRPVMWNGM